MYIDEKDIPIGTVWVGDNYWGYASGSLLYEQYLWMKTSVYQYKILYSFTDNTWNLSYHNSKNSGHSAWVLPNNAPIIDKYIPVTSCTVHNDAPVTSHEATPGLYLSADIGKLKAMKYVYIKTIAGVLLNVGIYCQGHLTLVIPEVFSLNYKLVPASIKLSIPE